MSSPRAKSKTIVRPVARTDPWPWPFVEVKWHDATSESNWKGQDDLPNVTVVISRGWLVRRTGICITLAGTIGIVDPKEDVEKKPDVGEIITIPRGCILPGYPCSLEMKAGPRRKVTLN